MFSSPKLQFCTNCGSTNKGKYRGSLGITLLLLCCGIIPGLIYETWKNAPGRCLCSRCGARALIPNDSPVAVALRAGPRHWVRGGGAV